MLKPMPAAMMGIAVGIVLGSLATVLLTRPVPEVRPPAAPASADPKRRVEPAAERPADRVPDNARADDRLPPANPTEKDREIGMLRAQLADKERTLATLREQVADEQAQREELEGKPVAWPADLDDRFREATLRRQITAALAEAHLTGEVTEVDCNEYPCIVYGRIDHHDGRGLEVLNDTEAMKAYEGGANNTSAWGGLKKHADGERQEAVFGIALYPKETDPERRGQVEKRLRVRHQAFWEQARVEEGP